MSEMVERVARAILAAHDFSKNDGAEGGFESLSEDWQECLRVQARAAIKAMKNPTNSMEVAGGLKMEAMLYEGDPDYTGVIFTDCGTVYNFMIDTALSIS